MRRAKELGGINGYHSMIDINRLLSLY